GTQAVTHVFIGLAPLVFQQFQGQQHAGRYWRTAPRGALFGKASGKALLDGLDHSVPREGIGPQANGVGLRYERGSLEARTASDEPVLQVAQATHGGLSFDDGAWDPHDTRRYGPRQPLNRGSSKVVTTSPD